mmetsp:Transcript_33863/g.97378  ORF Transcript_33863/g.97378 Transcript_33863/m.97378 type:complete len:654 (-) Transcript_33863:36-1997(-)
MVQDGATSDVAEASQVEKDIATIREGLRLMLTNELEEADKFWTTSCEAAAGRKLKPGEHDPRGAFTFVGALTALLHGLATLENNQLSDALERLQQTDQLIDAETDWPGKTVLKGLCMLLMGMVQTLQGKRTQGVWLILRSWMWLRLLEAEALPYQGPERSLVRSTALLALGVFNLIISLLPRFFMQTASWCSGMKGDRDTAIDFLRTCWEEDGLLAPFAVVVLVGYQVDIRTFLGEPRSDEAFAEADKWLNWAEERFPGGVFFIGLRANFCAVSRNVREALRISDSMAPMAVKLPALGLVMNARRASYAQANMEWSKAAAAFREAMQVYQKVGRRSFVPAMGANAALCHHMAGEEDKREEMIKMVLEYKSREDKKSWDRPDKYAFALAEDCLAGTWNPEMELYQLMTIKHRSTMFMSPEHTEDFLGKLRGLTEKHADNPDAKCRCLFLQAEIHRQSSAFDKGIEACAQGLALESSLSEQCKKKGYIQYMHFIAAACHFYSSNLRDAKESLRKLEACSRSHDLYYSCVFKTSQLNRRLGLEIKDAYLEVVVSNRSKLTLEASVPAETEAVEWDFALAEFSIGFVASYAPDSGEAPTKLQSLEKYDSSNGPVIGRFEPKGQAGKLVLTFDNSFSIMRSKTVLVRLQPDFLVLASR